MEGDRWAWENIPSIKRGDSKDHRKETFQKRPTFEKYLRRKQKRLGAVLQQGTVQGWRATHFASSILTSLEQKHSILELELLVVVWAIANFRNFVDTQFEVVSDHKALTSILKGNRTNRTYSSRSTRWLDHLLPFHITVTYAPGRALGVADYLSRHPSPSKNNVQVKAENYRTTGWR